LRFLGLLFLFVVFFFFLVAIYFVNAENSQGGKKGLFRVGFLLFSGRAVLGSRPLTQCNPKFGALFRWPWGEERRPDPGFCLTFLGAFENFVSHIGFFGRRRRCVFGGLVWWGGLVGLGGLGAPRGAEQFGGFWLDGAGGRSGHLKSRILENKEIVRTPEFFGHRPPAILRKSQAWWVWVRRRAWEKKQLKKNNEK